MTAIERCIKEAVEKGDYLGVSLEKEGAWVGGQVQGIENYWHSIVLDPLFWQALGKARGYSDPNEQVEYSLPTEYKERRKKLIDLEDKVGVIITVREASNTALVAPYNKRGSWEALWHRFIDHLISGKTAEEFFAELV